MHGLLWQQREILSHSFGMMKFATIARPSFRSWCRCHVRPYPLRTRSIEILDSTGIASHRYTLPGFNMIRLICGSFMSKFSTSCSSLFPKLHLWCYLEFPPPSSGTLCVEQVGCTLRCMDLRQYHHCPCAFRCWTKDWWLFHPVSSLYYLGHPFCSGYVVDPTRYCLGTKKRTDITNEALQRYWGLARKEKNHFLMKVGTTARVLEYHLLINLHSTGVIGILRISRTISLLSIVETAFHFSII